MTTETRRRIRHMFVWENRTEKQIAQALGLPLDDVLAFIDGGESNRSRAVRGKKVEAVEGGASSPRARSTIFDLPQGEPLDNAANEMLGERR